MWCLESQRLMKGSLQDTLSSEFRLPVWQGPGRGGLARGHPSPGQRIVRPVAGSGSCPGQAGAWGLRTWLHVCAEAALAPITLCSLAWIVGLGEGNPPRLPPRAASN